MTSTGLAALLVSGDIAHSEAIRHANQGVSDYLGNVHGKIDQYIFWAAAAWSSIKEYFPSLKKS